MDDADRRIDDALRGLVGVEASRDFGARVRARVEADGAGPRVWPRAAAVAALAFVALAAAVWVARPPDAPPSREIARQAAPPASLAPTARGEQRAVPRGGTFEAPAAPAVARATGRRAPAVPAAVRPADHERALDPLAPIETLLPSPIDVEAVALADLPLPPLASIAPLPLADDSGGLDR